MKIPVIVTGDDAALFLSLENDDAAFPIDTADTVEATVVSTDHETKLMPSTVAQSSTSYGADWANSLIAIKFTAAETTAIVTAKATTAAKIEVQVTLNGKKESWFSVVKIVKGHIV